MEIWATPTPLRTYTNSSLASCILVQLSDLCNLGFAVHVQYGYHQYMLKACPLLGVVLGCIAPPKFPNLQKKSPKLLFASKASLKNWEFYVFLDKEIAWNSGKGPPLTDLQPLRQTNSKIFAKMPTFRKSGRDPLFKNFFTLLRQKSLVWAWLKQVKCIGLGSKGWLRELSPLNVLSGGWSIL